MTQRGISWFIIFVKYA